MIQIAQRARVSGYSVLFALEGWAVEGVFSVTSQTGYTVYRRQKTTCHFEVTNKLQLPNR